MNETSESQSIVKLLQDEWMCCPICEEMYNVDRQPMTTRCGHTICHLCLRKLFAISNEPKCCICQDPISRDSPLNYNLFAMADALRTYSPRPNQISCNDCHELKRQERTKLCLTCALIMCCDEGSSDEEMQPYVFCYYCIGENHKNHEHIKYLPFKVEKGVKSAVTNGTTEVTDMHDLCKAVLEKVDESMVVWIQELLKLTSLNWSACSASTAKQIEETVKTEADDLTEATEQVLRQTRLLQQKYADSTRRLLILNGSLDEEYKIVDKETSNNCTHEQPLEEIEEKSEDWKIIMQAKYIHAIGHTAVTLLEFCV